MAGGAAVLEISCGKREAAQASPSAGESDAAASLEVGEEPRPSGADPRHALVPRGRPPEPWRRHRGVTRRGRLRYVVVSRSNRCGVRERGTPSATTARPAPAPPPSARRTARRGGSRPGSAPCSKACSVTGPESFRPPTQPRWTAGRTAQPPSHRSCPTTSRPSPSTRKPASWTCAPTRPPTPPNCARIVATANYAAGGADRPEIRVLAVGQTTVPEPPATPAPRAVAGAMHR